MAHHEMPQPTAAEILAKAKAANVYFVNLQFTDILGVVKSVTIPISQFEDCIQHGKWFDGSSIEGFVRIAESDMFLKPDLSTFAIIPWEHEKHAMARVICWVHTPDGERFAGDPRAVLASAVAEAEAMGFGFNTGPELEFFLFKPKADGSPDITPHDQGGYFDLSNDFATPVRADMVHALEGMGINVETAHHEVAIGQHEIDFQYDSAIRTADNAVTFRYTLKAIAQKHGLYASFMPKPIFGINGSGMHVHVSLTDKETGKNLFADPSDRYGLSDLARHFIAGLLKHAKGMIPILAPLVNSYKRLVPGYEAPVYISWARNNRSALIRVPRISNGQTQATRVELRCPDPSCNPYLAFAVMLKAGLDGVKNKLAPPDPVEENVYHLDEDRWKEYQVSALPASLGDAIEEMKKDPLIREALGDHLFERYIDAKTQEWDEYRTQVTDWEIKRYLSIF